MTMKKSVLAGAALAFWLAGTAGGLAAGTCSSHQQICMNFCAKNRSPTSIPTLSACQNDCAQRKTVCMSSGTWQLGINPRHPSGYAKDVAKR